MRAIKVRDAELKVEAKAAYIQAQRKLETEANLGIQANLAKQKYYEEKTKKLGQ